MASSTARTSIVLAWALALLGCSASLCSPTRYTFTAPMCSFDCCRCVSSVFSAIELRGCPKRCTAGCATARDA
eukprot:18420-Heterococcus_DN1.PRE.2